MTDPKSHPAYWPTYGAAFTITFDERGNASRGRAHARAHDAALAAVTACEEAAHRERISEAAREALHGAPLPLTHEPIGAPVNNTNPRPTPERLAQIRAFAPHSQNVEDLGAEIDAQAAGIAALREAARSVLDHFSDGHQARQLDVLRALLGEP